MKITQLNRSFNFIFAGFLLSLLSTSPLPAIDLEADADSSTRPVVALVLAGGGALGFAHVGVLKVLEEVGIQPEIVVGTSIGSIVGGLYSVGYSATEIEEIVGDIDWNATLFDTFNRKDLSFEQKTQQSEYYLSFPQIRDRSIADAGLSQAQHVMEILDQLFSKYPIELDFDSLPRRFRAIAADLITGEKVVYGDGDLKTAVRASMSVPGVFTPVEYRSRFLIDGGWVDNIPTTVAKELGADIIIAVALENMKYNASDLSTIFDVNQQAKQIRMLDRIEESLSYADIVIEPDLTGYTAADFGQSMPMIDLGYDAAAALRLQLKEVASLPVGPTLKKEEKSEPVAESQKLQIRSITINNGEGAITGRITPEKIQEDLGISPTAQELREYLLAAMIPVIIYMYGIDWFLHRMEGLLLLSTPLLVNSRIPNSALLWTSTANSSVTIIRLLI